MDPISSLSGGHAKMTPEAPAANTRHHVFFRRRQGFTA